MARTDQYVGLNERAKEFLDRKTKKDVFHLYKNGEIADRWEEPQKKAYGTIEGVFGNTFSLHYYFLHNGARVYEYIQAEPWDGGPMYYIALKDEEGNPIKESLWSEEEMGVRA